MANPQVKINLLFDANTTAAQQNIQQLSTLLQQISTKTTVSVDNGSLQQAASAAQQLQIHLQNAVNVDTGKLDLMKLQAGLKQSGTTLQTLTSQLRAVGPTGEQAFLKVANAVSQAQVPMVKANGLIANFMTTLANTAKWQVASSAIHGVMGMFQSATSHAKNLNKALTDIQIVTGRTTGEMANFARTANEAAAALSTTSTEYAKAALIFYQQGLSGDAVIERANTVVKLSQVTGQSAQEVSDQMTAIWNNFADGSQNLEYFADVLTKLGATTAASTDEIAAGLEKFAAIGETVGLSYEYAAASVATVVDKTRQSADVVGTAFKTIFARMQGLSLGETLEDGVDLNKYSQALADVGISVLTASGELRDMDDVLDELGEKWQGFGESTKVALAQTVGGVRQYNQMIALMDNWDGVVENIDAAKNATGELAKQQQIWADSYEGSLNNLNQAKNELYEAFVSDEFLIDWNNSFTVLIKSVTDFVDRIGGLGPLIFAIAGIFSKTLFPLVANGIKQLGNTIAVHSGKAAKQVAGMQQAMSDEMGKMLNSANLTNGMKKQVELSQMLLQEKQKLMLASKTMNEAQKAEATSRLAVAEAIMAETMKVLELQDALEKQAQAAKNSLTSGKAKWDVATTSATVGFKEQSANNAPEDETEEQRAAREATDDEIISMATTTSVSKLQDQLDAARAYKTNQAQLDAWAPTVAKTDAQKEKGEAWSREDQSIRDKSKNLQAKQDELLAALPEDALADLDAYISKLEKARGIQQDIYDIVNDADGGIEKAGVGVAGVTHSASYAEDEDVGKSEDNQLQKLSEETPELSFNADSGALEMEASLANYEKLYEVLGKQKILQSELAAAGQEVANAQKTMANAAANVTKAEKDLATAESKLTKEQKDAVKNVTSRSKAFKKLSKEQQDYVKAQEKLSKATKEQEAAQSKAVKTMTSAKGTFTDLAAKAGATDAQTKKLAAAFESLESGSADVNGDFKQIASVFHELGISADMVSGDIVELGGKMQAMLAAAGYGDDQINVLTSAFQQLANTAPTAANGINTTSGALDGLNGKVPNLTTSFGNIAQSTMSLAGNLMSLKSGIEGITSAFTEGGSAADIMQGVLSGILGIMPMFIAITNAAKAAQDKRNASTVQGVVADGAKAVSEGVKTGATWANTIANIANLLSNPWTMALAAVAIAAIGVTCAILESKTEKTKEDTQANLDNAKSQNELSSKWAESVTAMDNVIAKYNELSAAGKDTSDSIKDIVDAADSLVESYREAAASAEGLTDAQRETVKSNAELIDGWKERLEVATDPEEQKELIDKINKAQSETDAIISESAAESAQKGADAAMNKTAQAIVDVGDAKWKDGEVTRHVGGSGRWTKRKFTSSDGETALNEEEKAVEILMQSFGDGTETNKNRKNGYDVGLSTESSDAFLDDYEKLKAAAERMESELGDQLQYSDTYREIQEMLEGSKEQYDELKEMQAEADKYGVYDVKSDLEKQNFEGSGEAMTIENINSLEEYKEYRDKLLSDESIAGDPAAEAIAEQWLASNSALEKYEKVRKRVDSVAGDMSEDAAKELNELVNGFDAEETELFLQVDINKYQSTAAIQAEMQRLKDMAESEEIEVRIKAVETAQSSLKADGMTEEDWTNIRDNTIDWGKNGIMEFTDFLNMTYSEQQNFLQSMKETEEAALIASTKNTIAQMETNLATVQEQLNSHQYHGGDYDAWLAQHQQYQAEADAIQENIDLLNEELAIKEKLAQQAEIEAVGLDVAEVNDYADHLMRVADNSEMLADDLSELPEVAQDVAKATMRMNRGVESLADNFEDWSDVMKKSDKSSQEYAEALSGISDAVADIADVDAKWISDDFVSKNLDLIEEAASGSAEAIDELRSKLGADIAVQITLQNGLGQEAVDQVLALHQQLQNEIPDFQIGANVDTESFLANAQSIIDAAGMTAEQANEYFRSIGFEPTFKTEMQPVETFVPEYTTETATYPAGDYTYTYTAPDGSTQTGTVPNYRQVSKTYQSGGETMTQMMEVPALSSDGTPQIESIRKIGSGSMNNSSGSNSGGNTGGGGGGGGSPKKAEPSKKSDVVDRYKEINDTIADTGREMDKANKAADRLWGPSRLAMMKKENELLEDNIEQLKQKRREAEDNLAIDKKALEDTVSEEVGMKVEYDEGGNISNYDEIMNSLWDDLHAAETKAGDEWDDDEQAEIDAINDRIAAVKAAIEQYDETNTLAKDLDQEIQDKIYEWQDNNYEQLNYELEFKLEIEDSKLEMVEYYLGKIEDDIYATAEAFGYMGQQADIYTNKLEAQGDYVAQLEKDYAEGRISLDAYKEGLRESQSATIENLQALQEQKEAMQDYYGNVMEMALEEIALYTDEMEELNSVLDHYSNILELVGKQEDYATKGKVLNAKATNLRNEMQVQQELYEKSNAEAEKWASKMATAVEGSNEYETYKKNWIAAQEAANEAQDAMLSKTEEWAEAMKAVVENELAGLAKTMEESLTGGTSFDELLTSMERRSSLQEEYLTTTNQIYETNKLMRQAQQEIDKSSNSVAKRKLQNFINETAQMQEQSELSQYELDIQQAKYDLLLAEIALEEAQSAKSTVRLQRDSEGNFGYVYTADQGAVGEAEQNLADKQNALYNIGLEGANDYTQKYAETMQEAQDAITELTEMWMNGEIESEEEFQRRKAEIQDYYYEKLKQYSNLYQVALTTDSNVIADAWSTDFNDMIYKTDDWKTAVDGYFEGAAVSMGTWADVCATVLEESGLDDVETTVGNITTKSEELKNTLIGEDGESGVVGAMMSEVEAAGELSEAYVGIQNEIDKTIAKYEELLKKINEDYTDPNTKEVDPAIDPEDEEKDDTKEDDTKTEEPTTPELKVGSMVTVKKNASKWASGESIWNPVKGNNFKVKKVDGEKILIGDPSGPNYSASGITGWIKKTDLEGFATGGYTGDWEGSYGKLAMLHQKELVLNAGDTENFLAGMDLLDKIVSAIDLYSMNSQLSGALSSPSLGNMGGKDTLEQQVHIEASFPGVQDRNEIEEAFNTLINRASQYANRK